MLLSCCRGIGAHLALRGQSHSVSLVEAGSFGFLSSCDRDFREPLELLQGSQASFQDARGTLGFLLSQCMGNRASSQVEAGNSGFLSSCNRDLWVPIKFQQGSQASSCVDAWNSTFRSGCKRGVRPPEGLRWGTWDFSGGATRESDLPCVVRGYLGLHSSR